jgi:hypothetical protein
MSFYSCRMENRDGSQDQFELGDFSSEERAVHAARNALLVSLSGRNVELWRERDLVGRYCRDVAQFRSRSHPFAGLTRN